MKHLVGPNLFRLGQPTSRPSSILNDIHEVSALAFEVGLRGMLIDSGWIRMLGEGSEVGQLEEWNSSNRLQLTDDGPSFYLGHDVIGGLFLLNRTGEVVYVSPDSLEIEDLTENYDEFLEFLLSGDLSTFYKDYRFKNWTNAVSRLSCDQSFFSYPPLWAEGGDKAFRKKRDVVPALELRTFLLQALEAADSE